MHLMLRKQFASATGEREQNLKIKKSTTFIRLELYSFKLFSIKPVITPGEHIALHIYRWFMFGGFP